MSAHYSKFLLNTYSSTPYFQAQVPQNYPLDKVLRKCRAYRRLPPNLRRLAWLAKRWAQRHYSQFPAGVRDQERWYDSRGNELEPTTGRKLTDVEIDDQWDAMRSDPSLTGFMVHDLPVPGDGFPNPDTWEESPTTPSKKDDREYPSPEQLGRDLASRGPEAVATTYGLTPREVDPESGTFLQRRLGVLDSPYFEGKPEALAFLTAALCGADTYSDLGGAAKLLFDRVEASEVHNVQHRDPLGRWLASPHAKRARHTLERYASSLGKPVGELDPHKALQVLGDDHGSVTLEHVQHLLGKADGGSKPAGTKETVVAPAPAPSPIHSGMLASHVHRLAQQGHGVASLADLHEALGKPDLHTFHRAINDLRRTGTVEAVEAEGRGGIDARAQATMLHEPGSRTGGLGSRIIGVQVRDPEGLRRLATNARSFFTTCERDDLGHCEAEGGGEAATAASTPPGKRIPTAHLRHVQQLARDKAKKAPRPTREERAEAKEGIARLGANRYRRNLVGNTKNRKDRRDALLKEFGDGEKCPCVYCGLVVTHGTLEQDKIYTTAEGGRYRLPNLVPSCPDCNKMRGDVPFKEIEWGGEVAKEGGTR